jgi:hypothetical protein
MLAALSMVLCGAAFAQNNVPHTDGFEGYPTGPLAPQGGWEMWNQAPSVNGLVNTTQAHTGTKSVKTVASEGGQSDTDLIYRYQNHQFQGCYKYTVYHYLPGNEVGETYFILLSIYNHNGQQVWAVQLHFNASTNLVTADFDLETLPTIEDRWVEIRVEINYGTDEHQIYYGGTPMFQAPKSWSAAMNGGNLPQVASSDWYANLVCCQFYDDLDFQKVNCPPPPLTGCIYKASKNSKAKGGCEACPLKNDCFSSDVQCGGPNNCIAKFKGSIPCPGGGPGVCKIKGKRFSCNNNPPCP